MNPNPPCAVLNKICIFFCCRQKTDLARVNAFALWRPDHWKSSLVLSVQTLFKCEFKLNWLVHLISRSASFGSGVSYCMFSSHFEFLRDGCRVFTFCFTLHKLSIVDPLHSLSFDWDKRKTCSDRAMVVQGLICSWRYMQNQYKQEVVTGTRWRISMTDLRGFSVFQLILRNSFV